MLRQENLLNAPLKCYHNERYFEHGQPLEKEAARYLLSTINRIYRAEGIELILSYGTLLGAIRENDFIANDSDMDTMIWAKDMQKALDLASELLKYDIHLHCYVLPWIFTYEYKGVTCDIDVLHEAIWPWKIRYCLTDEKYIPKAFFEKTKQIEFLGEMYAVPADTEKVLVYHYGKNWRIPSNGQGRIESYVFFWRYAHRFIKKCIRNYLVSPMYKLYTYSNNGKLK